MGKILRSIVRALLGEAWRPHSGGKASLVMLHTGRMLFWFSLILVPPAFIFRAWEFLLNPLLTYAGWFGTCFLQAKYGEVVRDTTGE